MSTENIHGGPSMINGVSWVKGCKTPKNMMDPMNPLGDSKHKCADLLIGDYTNCKSLAHLSICNSLTYKQVTMVALEVILTLVA